MTSEATPELPGSAQPPTRAELDATFLALGSQLRELRAVLEQRESRDTPRIEQIAKQLMEHTDLCDRFHVLVQTQESRISKLEQIVRQLQGLPSLSGGE